MIQFNEIRVCVSLRVVELVAHWWTKGQKVYLGLRHLGEGEAPQRGGVSQ